jgi:hypothetical protein
VPMASGTWEVRPFGDENDPTTPEDEEVAQFVQWALMDHMAPNLYAHIWELWRVVARAGRVPFEQIYEVAQWRDRTVLTLKTLDLRLPRTIQRYIQDGPDLVALEQWTPNGGQAMLPMRDVVFYRLGAEGDNWEGEALDPATPIATPDGWRTMGDLRPGDKVFDETGSIRYVTARRDWQDRPCYAVTFSSGETVVADANHKWMSHTHKVRHRGGAPELLSTEQMAATAKYGKLNNHAVPLAGALDRPAQHLLIDPYVLGYWLGDGSAAGGMITTADEEVLTLFAERGYPTRPLVGARYGYCVKGGLGKQLIALGLINNKHVPEQYLRGSFEQRYELLRGLMDSDGNVGGKNAQCAEFSNTNRDLADAVLDLTRGLGGRARIQTVLSKGPQMIMGRLATAKDLYRVHFTTPANPFCMARKAERWAADKTIPRAYHFIQSIVPVEPRTTVCIEVDSPSHLFLAGRSLLATHNSLLRPAYKHWKYKAALELVEAIGLEKTAVGVPTGYPPRSAAQDELDAFEEFLSTIRANEASFFMAPGPRADHASTVNGTDGWFWEFVTPAQDKAAAVAIDAAIQRHAAKIDAVVLGEFMRLGQQGVGARATADVQQDPFLALVETLAAIVIEAPINTQLIPRLVGLNYSTTRMPKLACSLIDSTSLEELATFASTLAAQGLLRPEPTLEAYLRAKADFPEADEQAIAQQADEAMKRAQEMAALAPEKPAPGEKPKPGAKPAEKPPTKLDAEPKTLARSDRPLKAWEQTMSLDRIEATIDDAQARLEASAGEQTRALAVAMARGQKASTTDLEAAIEATLEGLFVTGRATVVEELQRQKLGDLGWMLDAGGPDEIPPAERKTLRDRAKAIAATIRAQVVAAVASIQIQRGATDASVQASAEAAAMAALRGQAQVHASSVLNAGRTVQATTRRTRSWARATRRSSTGAAARRALLPTTTCSAPSTIRFGSPGSRRTPDARAAGAADASKRSCTAMSRRAMRERELDRIWRGLAECEAVRDPDALNMWRGMAARQLDAQIEATIVSQGAGALSGLLAEVDMRGW